MNNTEGNNQGEEGERIERLRLILERQQSRPVSADEAAEVGEGLITFFQVLGEAIDEGSQQAELALGATHG
jgi:hypothetical protein